MINSPVTVYSKYDCQPCRLTKAYLDRNNIPFQEINVEDDPDAYALVQSMGYLQVPVVVADSVSWSGLRPDKLAEIPR
jgi:glutaredoxin-like protein NrdH